MNPRFGANRQASALNLAPMQLTLDVRFDVGPERERQDLFLQLRTGRGGKGNKMSEQQIKQRYVRSYPNPFEQMLRQADSLGLSNDVADSIAILNKTYGKAIDSIWTPVAKYLAALPDKYDLDEAYERVRAAENQSLDKMAIYGPAAKSLLTPEQVRKLPPFIALFLDNQALRHIRPGRAGWRTGRVLRDLIDVLVEVLAPHRSLSPRTPPRSALLFVASYTSAIRIALCRLVHLRNPHRSLPGSRMTRINADTCRE